jgi:membrane associated rhomboid family serine protease
MRNRAPATIAIAAATAIVSILLLLGDQVGFAAIYAGFIPARFGDTLGMLDQSGLLPAWVTPFSATFVHASFLHLGFNIVMLGYTGTATERAVGAGGIVMLYLVSAVTAVAAHWLLDPASAVPMIGASGAISGIVGAYSVLFSRSRARAIGPVPARVVQALWLVAAWAAINLAVGFISAGSSMPVAGAAHVGGFIAGVLLARPLVRWHWRGA